MRTRIFLLLIAASCLGTPLQAEEPVVSTTFRAPTKTLPEAVPPAAPVDAPTATPASRLPNAEQSPAVSTSAAPLPVPAMKPVATQKTIEILFVYGSEKQRWVEAVTATFNAEGRTLSNGDRIKVVTKPMGSGALIEDVGEEKVKADLVSPAAGAFILRGNAASREDGKSDLVGETRSLVSSPIVVAAWREVAEGLGWPKKPVHWKTIFGYASDPERWKAIAPPGFRDFTLAHTDAESSNSGLHALLLEAYTAVGKFKGFGRADAQRKEVSAFVAALEKHAPFYVDSTGFLGQRMSRENPGMISAAFLYENLVIEANKELAGKDPNAPRPRIVAIYPVEGTFPCEHPVAIVNRPWVTPEHREASEIYIKYLLARPQQEQALKWGFRPSDESVDPSELFKEEYGVTQSTVDMLKPPPASALRILLDVWKEHRSKQANVAETR